MKYKILYMPTGCYIKDVHFNINSETYLATTDTNIGNKSALKDYLRDLYNDVINQFPAWAKCNDIAVNIIPQHLVIHKVNSKGVIIDENYFAG